MNNSCLLILKIPSQCGISTALPAELQEIKIDGKNQRSIWFVDIKTSLKRNHSLKNAWSKEFIARTVFLYNLKRECIKTAIVLLPKGLSQTVHNSKLTFFLEHFENLLLLLSQTFCETHILVHKSINKRMTCCDRFSWVLSQC